MSYRPVRTYCNYVSISMLSTRGGDNESRVECEIMVKCRFLTEVGNS